MQLSSIVGTGDSIIQRVDALIPRMVGSGATKKAGELAADFSAVDHEVAGIARELGAVLPEPAVEHLQMGRAAFAGEAREGDLASLGAYRAGVGELFALARALDTQHPGASAAAVQSLQGAETVFAANLLEDAARQARTIGAHFRGGIGQGTESLGTTVGTAHALSEGAIRTVVRYDGLPYEAGIRIFDDPSYSLRMREVTHHEGLASITSRPMEIAEMAAKPAAERDEWLGAMAGKFDKAAEQLDALSHDSERISAMGRRALELPGSAARDADGRLRASLERADLMLSRPGGIAPGGESEAMAALGDRLDVARAMYDDLLDVSNAIDGDPDRGELVERAASTGWKLLDPVNVPGAELLPASDLRILDSTRRSLIEAYNHGPAIVPNLSQHTAQPDVLEKVDTLTASVRSHAADPSGLQLSRHGLRDVA